MIMLAVLLVISGCGPAARAPVTRATALQVVDDNDWPVMFDDLDMASFLEACDQSLTYLRRLPENRSFTFGPLRVTAAEMITSLEKAKDIFIGHANPSARTLALRNEFVLLRSVGSKGQGTVLMTGYYEPVMAARREPSGEYVHPLYAVPQDLVRIDLKLFGDDLPKRKLVGQVKEHVVVPFPDRDQIEHEGAIAKTAEVLAYLSDQVESFFLHIQGSGQVVFADGSRLRLGYAASNGRPYRSIGALLINEGLMERHAVSMQSIRKFLAENPQHKRRILAHNPSYVFFRTLSAEGGPLGCYNVPVTGGRSIATDRRLFPGGALAFIHGKLPTPDGRTTDFTRFVFNQDTGGAIRGPGRLDLFFGSGDAAGESAGRMKYPGGMYFLAPRSR